MILVNYFYISMVLIIALSNVFAEYELIGEDLKPVPDYLQCEDYSYGICYAAASSDVISYHYNVNEAFLDHDFGRYSYPFYLEQYIGDFYQGCIIDTLIALNSNPPINMAVLSYGLEVLCNDI